MLTRTVHHAGVRVYVCVQLSSTLTEVCDPCPQCSDLCQWERLQHTWRPADPGGCRHEAAPISHPDAGHGGDHCEGVTSGWHVTAGVWHDLGPPSLLGSVQWGIRSDKALVQGREKVLVSTPVSHMWDQSLAFSPVLSSGVLPGNRATSPAPAPITKSRNTMQAWGGPRGDC